MGSQHGQTTMNRQPLPLKMRGSFTSAALTGVLGVCSAAAVLMVAYYALRAQLIPPLPLAALALLFPFAALVATLLLKWRHPGTTKIVLTAYFSCVLLVLFFGTLSVLPLEF